MSLSDLSPLIMTRILSLFFCGLLSACAYTPTQAPVSDGWHQQKITPKKIKKKSKSPCKPQPLIEKSNKNKHFSKESTKIVWEWPTYGRIIHGGTKTAGLLKGITIRNKVGAPIYAAAPGVIVYSGHDLKEYGNLVIIKHNKDYFSAYAYNRTLLVKEGQPVHAHQKIAETGYINITKTPGLYFEIRKKGIPVDPLTYLPKQIS